MPGTEALPGVNNHRTVLSSLQDFSEVTSFMEDLPAGRPQLLEKWWMKCKLRFEYHQNRQL